MKKTIRIHISGYIYNIDEDAYSILENWLKSIQKQYENEEDGDEIFNDIEMRVAELFNESIGNEGVVTMKDVNSIIQTMGKPEEFEESENIYSEKANTGSKKSKNLKRFYRDEDNNFFAGVCSGLGNYFGLDPVIIRLIFVAAFFIGGFGPVIYIILWIIIPKAETVSQKLEMMGEPVNISNIEKAIKEEFEFVKEKFTRRKKKKKNI